MLFLLFQLGKERYALPANRVVEVVPLLTLKPLPQAPRGVAGIFNYRGRPVPALDLSEITMGRPAQERLSTRIVILNYPSPNGGSHLVGLIAEHATGMLRKDLSEFKPSGIQLASAPFLGPVLMDSQGVIQLIREEYLVPDAVRQMLLPETAAITDAAN
jgi:chemotaxis-related protein WspB